MGKRTVEKAALRKLLYVLSRTGGTITGFNISSTGTLTRVPRVAGVPTTSYGLAGY